MFNSEVNIDPGLRQVINSSQRYVLRHICLLYIQEHAMITDRAHYISWAALWMEHAYKRPSSSTPPPLQSAPSPHVIPSFLFQVPFQLSHPLSLFFYSPFPSLHPLTLLLSSLSSLPLLSLCFYSFFLLLQPRGGAWTTSNSIHF